MRIAVIGTGLMLLAVAGLAASPARGRTIYRWTDERGVIHFADGPPLHVTDYTVRQFPAAPPPVAAVPPAPEAAPAATPAAGKARRGPARVVITDREHVSAGGSVQTFSGKVENKGGAEARDVIVMLKVVEPAQGEECLDDIVAIEPPTLGPGDTGVFEVEYDNPCFFGPINVEMTPEWQ